MRALPRRGRLLPLLLSAAALHSAGFVACAATEQQQQCRIAVVGAGIGGTAAAYYARQLLEDDTCTITVFERSLRIGGRVENVSWTDGEPMEIGASILYSKNQHLVDAIDALGLHAGPPIWDGSSEGVDGTMGIWDGSRLAFRSFQAGWLTALRVLWRYGPVRMYRLQRVVAETLQRFMGIYQLQGAAPSTCPVAFATPRGLWEAVGLFDLTQVSLRSYLEAQGVGGADSNIVKEFVGSVNRVNYNQNNDLNALAGLVSLCPTTTGEVVSVQEGNARVAEAMLEAAGAAFRPNVSVGTIHIVPGSSNSSSSSVYQLESTDGVALGQFDAVVLATPFAFSSIDIIGPEVQEEGDNSGSPGPLAAARPPYPPLTYQTTHATFVEGSVRPSFFGNLSDQRGAPGSIYAAENCSSTLSSLSLHMRVNATHGVYKAFSSEALGPALLDELFTTSWAVLHHREWQAYPRFHPPEQMCPFIVRPYERIFYTSALETAVSAMEISAIAAKNVAILLAQSLEKGAWAPGGKCTSGDRQEDGVTAEM